MANLKVFLISMMAVRDVGDTRDNSHMADVVLKESIREAKQYGIEKALAVWPKDKGWELHHVDIKSWTKEFDYLAGVLADSDLSDYEENERACTCVEDDCIEVMPSATDADDE